MDVICYLCSSVNKPLAITNSINLAQKWRSRLGIFSVFFVGKCNKKFLIFFPLCVSITNPCKCFPFFLPGETDYNHKPPAPLQAFRKKRYMVAIWGGLSNPFLHIRSPSLLDPNLFPYKMYPSYCTPPTPLMTYRSPKNLPCTTV